MMMHVQQQQQEEDLFPLKPNPLFSAVFVSNDACNSVKMDENARHGVDERESLLYRALETGRLQASGQGDVGPVFSSGITLEHDRFGQDTAADYISSPGVSKVHVDDRDRSLHGSMWARHASTSQITLGQSGMHVGCMVHGTLSASDTHELNIASLNGIVDASVPRMPVVSIETQLTRTPVASRTPVCGTLSCEVGPCAYRHATVRYDVSTSPMRYIDTQKLSWTCDAAHGRRHAVSYSKDCMPETTTSRDSTTHLFKTTLWKLNNKKKPVYSAEKESKRRQEQQEEGGEEEEDGCMAWHMPQIDMEWSKGSHIIACKQPLYRNYQIKASRNSKRDTTSVSLRQVSKKAHQQYGMEWTCHSMSSISASRSSGTDTYRVSWKPTQGALSLSYTRKKKKDQQGNPWHASTTLKGNRGSILHKLNFDWYLVF